MAKHGDVEVAIGTVYAAAIYALAAEKNQIDAVHEELKAVAKLVEGNAALSTFLASPTVNETLKRSAVEKAFRGRCGDTLVDAMQVMNRGGRLPFIGAVAEAFGHIDDEQRGGLEVLVRTATPLNDAHRERIRSVVAERTGRKPRLVESVDPSLLGGLILRIGDKKMDASVARKLAVLSNGLEDRASREIHGGREYVAA